jgi:hypothetical protein
MLEAAPDPDLMLFYPFPSLIGDRPLEWLGVVEEVPIIRHSPPDSAGVFASAPRDGSKL